MALALAAAIPAPTNWVPVAVGIALSAAGFIRGISIKPSYVDLLLKNAESEQKATERQALFRSLIEVLLRQLCAEVGLTGSKSRISAFSHNGKAFVMIGRVAENPQLNVAGRALYSDKEGIIGIAWAHGSDVATRLPDSLADYKRKSKEKFGLSAGVVSSLTMKSRSLVAVRVDDPRTSRHTGVVVLESLLADGVNSTKKSQLLSSRTWEVLQTFLATSHDQLPDMYRASQEGF